MAEAANWPKIARDQGLARLFDLLGLGRQILRNQRQHLLGHRYRRDGGLNGTRGLDVGIALNRLQERAAFHRLRHVRHASRVQAGVNGFAHSVGRKSHNRSGDGDTVRSFPSPYRLSRLIAIQHRHIQVHKNQIEHFATLHRVQCLLAGEGEAKVHGFSSQIVVYQQPVIFRVLGHQYPDSVFRRGELASGWRSRAEVRNGQGPRWRYFERQTEMKIAATAFLTGDADFSAHQLHQIAANR